LWVGCQSGLYRFDGVSFERVDLLPKDSLESRSVRTLLATRDGSLWVLFAIGRIARLNSSDRTTPIWLPANPSGEKVRLLDEDGSGTVLAYTFSSKAYAFQGDQLRAVESVRGFPAGDLRGTIADTRGNYWVLTSRGLAVLQNGKQRFENLSARYSNATQAGISHTGQIWVADGQAFRLVEDDGNNPPRPGNVQLRSRYDAAALLSRDGSWWTADCPVGVCRAWPSASNQPVPRSQFAADAFTRLDGLSSDRAMTLFEDKEGSIWVGTKQGLDQFRKNPFVRVQFPMPLSYFSMTVDAEKGIWTGTDYNYDNMGNDLWKLDPKPSKLPGFESRLSSAFTDRDGSTIFGGEGAAWRFFGGRMTRMEMPLPRPNLGFRTVAKDADGHLWASFRGDQTYRWDDKRWILKGGLETLHAGMATVAMQDHDGALWLGFQDNVISVIRGNQATNYSAADGLGIGPVTSLSTREPILAGGEFGLNLLVGKRFLPLLTDHEEGLRGISGIARTMNGDLWLHGAAGAVHIAATEFSRAVVDPTYRMHSRVYDADDGLTAGAQQAMGTPSVVEDKQGRLWFATADGLAWFEHEDRQPQDGTPLDAQILSLSTQQISYPPRQHLQLPAGTRNLVVRYTALSLKVPERVQFRFRLRGIDKEWRFMGNARSANYSNLGPGTYRAEVSASNDDGVWNEKGASMDFSIRAAFYQTQWFMAACAAIALLAVWALLRIQVVRSAKRAAASMAGRMQERERIARELHDTLLQDVQALGLHLRALHIKYGENDSVSAELARLDDAAHRSLADARARVSGLRAGQDANELSEVFREFGEHLAALYPAHLLVEREGSPVNLHPVAADEIVAIGKEALLNAFRHAQARNVRILVAYKARKLEISISDDGKGFVLDAVTQPGSTPGHWGIRGMQERASAMKAKLSVQAQPGEGAGVSLSVAASIAYKRS
jgi:signal transduction histidine kinase/ligand-binding sensor domain-containing protein